MNVFREFKLIKQKFARPYTFSSITWKVRKSIVLREKSQTGNFVYGEIAPVPGFPNQSGLEDVLEECKKWVNYETLPVTNFLLPALSCMKSEFWRTSPGKREQEIHKSILSIFNSNENDSPSFKKKIGALPVSEEITETKKWLSRLPVSSLVRLDANGSLSIDDLRIWLEEFQEENRIQYIEQPLADKFREELFLMAENAPIPLAIDESVIAMEGPYQAENAGWKGFYVIKPTLLNDWSESINFAKENKEKAVFSTSFESPFGYEALLRACIHSNLDAGITREPFKNLSTELNCHHSQTLFSPAATQFELDELWEKI